jgi:hypothetical protein
MDSFAGTTLMGSQPVAGRARSMHVCGSEQSIAAYSWLHATKPAARTFATVAADANRHRRPRGSS